MMVSPIRNIGRARCLSAMSRLDGWARNRVAGFTNTKRMVFGLWSLTSHSDWDLSKTEGQRPKTKQFANATRNHLSFLSEMPRSEPAGSGILFALRDAFDDRRTAGISAGRFGRDHAARRALAGTAHDS